MKKEFVLYREFGAGGPGFGIRSSILAVLNMTTSEFTIIPFVFASEARLPQFVLKLGCFVFCFRAPITSQTYMVASKIDQTLRSTQ